MLSSSRLVWKEKRPLEQARAGSASAVIGRDLIVAGGTDWDGDIKRWLDRVDFYDTVNDRWRRGPSLPRPFAYGGFVSTAGGFEILGGCDGTGGYRDSWILETGAAAWSRGGNSPDNLVFSSVESWDGRLCAFGGCSNERELGTSTGVVWMREENDSWRQVSVLPRRDLIMSAHCCAGGKVYLFGGCSQPGGGALGNHDDAMSFDFGAIEWRRLRSLPGPVRAAAAAAVDDRWIYIIGGYTGTEFSKNVWVYDIETDSYRADTPLPIGIVGTSFCTYKGILYGAGGEDRMRSRSPKLLVGTPGPLDQRP